MSSFELNESDWYEVQTAVPNDFLNERLDSEDYGIWYSVKFVGDAESYLWQTKTAPTPSEKYWGWLETTKSGKSTKFKWDKKNAPTGGTQPASPKKTDAYLKDVTNTPIQIYNGSLNYAKEAGLNLISNAEDRQAYLEYVKDITDELLDWIDNIRNKDLIGRGSDEVSKEVVPESE